MEYNKLIAEFMGMNIHHNDNSMMVRETPQGNEVVPIDVLQYDTSWDWLMPVANEIIKSRDEQNADWDLTDLKYALCTTNIEWVYNAVVKFIKDSQHEWR
ncbi:hypothetical protein [uncultured Mediterranean phage uvMED]|nr:hypothetical protein [uncultured Mediterranean phage uvMED]